MNITVTGRIEQQDFGFGIWTIISEEGEIYELKEPPLALCQPHNRIKVTGQIREDVMTLAMVGKVLEVRAFEVLDS